MDTSHRSLFRRSALLSGLVTQETLDEACSLLESAGTPAGEIADGQLAAKLVEMACLNRWQAEQLLLGRTKFTLGGYQIIDSIGQGGMGQVFKAEHPIMGRVVAVKVLPRDHCTPDAIASFSREIRAQAQLDHENLVRAHDAGREGNVHYLVTEYVPGADLRRHVRLHGPLTMTQAASLITQAARGLSHAHERGLIHRDVKPGNLLVMPDGRVKVSDLGLVGSLATNDDPRSGKVLGTSDYLSPEQILTPTEVTPASDVYALGCSMYYAVTGKVPFPGGTTRDKLRRHCDATPLTPRRLNPDLSEEFVDVIADMMKKDPRERIGTMTEVIARLAPWSGERAAETAETARDVEARSVSEGRIAPPSNPSLTRSASEGRVIVPLPPEPPLTFIPTPAPNFPDMKDTEPELFGFGPQDPWFADSPSQVSQISQGTEPFASALEETLPHIDPRRLPRPRPASSGISTVQLGLLVLFGAVTISLLAAVVYLVIHKGW